MKKIHMFAALLAMLLPTMVFAGGGGTTTYDYSATVSVTASGNGTVYVGRTNPSSDKTKKTDTQSNSGVEDTSKTYTFYAFAEPDSGYEFTGWSDGADTPSAATSKVTVSLDTNTKSKTVNLTATFAKVVTFDGAEYVIDENGGDLATLLGTVQDGDKIIINKDVTIAKGVSLTIPSGIQVTISSGKKLIVKGNLSIHKDARLVGEGTLAHNWKTITQAADVRVPFPLGTDGVAGTGNGVNTVDGTAGKYLVTSVAEANNVSGSFTCKEEFFVTVENKASGETYYSKPSTSKPVGVLCTVAREKALNWIVGVSENVYTDYATLLSASATTAATKTHEVKDTNQLSVLLAAAGTVTYDGNSTSSSTALGFAVDLASTSITLTTGKQWNSLKLVRFFNGSVTVKKKVMNTNFCVYNCSGTFDYLSGSSYYTAISFYDSPSVKVSWDDLTSETPAGGQNYYGGGTYNTTNAKFQTTPKTKFNTVYWGTFASGMNPTTYLYDTNKVGAEQDPKQSNAWVVYGIMPDPNAGEVKVNGEDTTLVKALANPQAGDVIVLQRDIAVESDVLVSTSASNVRIDLNGWKLTGANAIINNGDLEIIDVNGNGQIDVPVINNGTLLLSSAKYNGPITLNSGRCYFLEGTFNGGVAVASGVEDAKTVAEVCGGTYATLTYAHGGQNEALVDLCENGYVKDNAIAPIPVSYVTNPSFASYSLSAFDSSTKSLYTRNAARSGYTREEWIKLCKLKAASALFSGFGVDCAVTFDRAIAANDISVTAMGLYTFNVDVEIAANNWYSALFQAMRKSGQATAPWTYGTILPGGAHDGSLSFSLSNKSAQNGTLCLVEMRLATGIRNMSGPKDWSYTEYVTTAERKLVLGAGTSNAAMIRPASGAATFYATLGDAMDAAADGGTVMLANDCDTALPITKVGTYTFDTMGFAHSSDISVADGLVIKSTTAADSSVKAFIQDAIATTYEVVQTVAKVGDQSFYNLTDAVAVALNSGEVVTLLADTNESVVLNKGQSLKLAIASGVSYTGTVTCSDDNYIMTTKAESGYTLYKPKFNSSAAVIVKASGEDGEENGYDTLAEALSNAGSGATVTVYWDLTLADSAEVPAGVTLTVDSGATLTVNGTLAVLGTLSNLGTVNGSGKVGNNVIVITQTGDGGASPYVAYGSTMKYYKTTTSKVTSGTITGVASSMTSPVVKVSKPDGTVICGAISDSSPKMIYCTVNTSDAVNSISGIVSSSASTSITASIASGRMAVLLANATIDGPSDSTGKKVAFEGVIDCATCTCKTSTSKEVTADDTRTKTTIINCPTFEIGLKCVNPKYDLIGCTSITIKTFNAAYGGTIQLFDCGPKASVTTTFSSGTDTSAWVMRFYGGQYDTIKFAGTSKFHDKCKVWAGSFKLDPTGHLGDDQTLEVKYANPYYTVTVKLDEDTAAAKVTVPGATGDPQFYETLSEAFEQATTGSKIDVLKNGEFSTPITVNKELTVELNGRTITAANGAFVNNGTLTIQDSSNNENPATLSTTSGNLIVNYGTMDITYGTYNGNILLNSGTFTTHGGTFTGTLTAASGTNAKELANLRGGTFSQSVTSFLREGYSQRSGNVGEYPVATVSSATISGSEQTWLLTMISSSDKEIYAKGKLLSAHSSVADWRRYAELDSSFSPYWNLTPEGVVMFDRATSGGTVTFYGKAKSSSLPSQSLSKDVDLGEPYPLIIGMLKANGISTPYTYKDYVQNLESLSIGIKSTSSNNDGTVATTELQFWQPSNMTVGEYMRTSGLAPLAQTRYMLGGKKAAIDRGANRLAYDSLAAAASAAQDGETVLVGADTAEAVTLPGAGTFTIDPYGFAYTGTVSVPNGCFLKSETSAASAAVAQGVASAEKTTYVIGLKVAQVGETFYESLADAVAAANGEVVTLLAATDETITLTAEGQSFTLNKNDIAFDDAKVVTSVDGSSVKTTTADGVTVYSLVKDVVSSGDVHYPSIEAAIAAAEGDTVAVTVIAADAETIALDAGKTLSVTVADGVTANVTVNPKDGAFIETQTSGTTTTYTAKQITVEMEEPASAASVAVSKIESGTESEVTDLAEINAAVAKLTGNHDVPRTDNTDKLDVVDIITVTPAKIVEEVVGGNTIIRSATFDVVPNLKATLGEGQKLKFRLPVDASATQLSAIVYHSGVQFGIYPVQTYNDEKFIEAESDAFSPYGYTLLDGETTNPVAAIGTTGYATLAAAAAAAQSGDVIKIIADISDEAVEVATSVTITSADPANPQTLNNVSINATGSDIALTVSDLAFTGNSWINSANGGELTVENVTADVSPSNGSVVNSRSTFIGLGKNEAKTLALTVKDCNIVVPTGTDAILGWATITEADIEGNTIGSATKKINSGDAIKIMGVASGAILSFVGNTVYSDYNGITIEPNTTRENDHTAIFERNTFIGGADHIWIDAQGTTVSHATVLATSDNTVNSSPLTAADIKNNDSTWTSYAGVDVVTNAAGKVIAGTFTSFSSTAAIEAALADDYKYVASSGTYVVTAKTYVAQNTTTGVKYESLAAAVAAVPTDGTETTITMLAGETLSSTVTFPANTKIVLDLNGQTIDNQTTGFSFASDTSPARFTFIVDGELTVQDSGTGGNISIAKANNATTKAFYVNGKLTVNGGTISADYSAAYVNANGEMIVNDGVVHGDSYAININKSNGHVIINGGTVTAAGEATLCTNGNEGISNPGVYDINGGTIENTGAGAAIYNPNRGTTVNVHAPAVITGGTGIVMKGGTLNIDGGTISGTGAFAAAAAASSGFTSTGDAIYVEDTYSTYGYNFNPTVNITGGTFTSANGYAAQYYTQAAAVTASEANGSINISGNPTLTSAKQTDATNSTALPNKVVIAGGSFTHAVPEEYCADGYIPTAQNPDTGRYSVKTGSYVAQIGDVKYETFAEAIAAADAAVAGGGEDPVIIVLDATAEQNNQDWKFVDDKLVRKAYVAQIVRNDAIVGKYESLEEAYSAATNGDTIEMLANYRLSGAITFNKSVTLTGAVDAEGKPKYTVYGNPATPLPGGMPQLFVNSPSSPIDLTFQNLNFSEFGNETGARAGFGFIYISKNSNADTHLLISNVTMTAFNCDAITAIRGDLEVVDCVIDGAGAPGELSYGIRVGNHDVALNPTLSVVRTVIRNIANDATWAGQAIVAGASSSVTVTDCTITNVANGVTAIGNNADGSARAASVTIANTLIDASSRPFDIGRSGYDGEPITPTQINVTSGTFYGIVDIASQVAEKATIAISGGNFDREVPEGFCANGYIPTQQDPVTHMYTVKIGQYIAAVYDDNDDLVGKYETLFAAVRAAQDGYTVELLADREESVTINKSITLEGEHKITGTINIDENAAVAMRELTIDANGVIYAVNISGGGSVDMQGVTVGGGQWCNIHLNNGRLTGSGITMTGDQIVVAADGQSYTYRGETHNADEAPWGLDVTKVPGKTLNVPYMDIVRENGTDVITLTDQLTPAGSILFVANMPEDETLTGVTLPARFCSYTLTLDADIDFFGGAEKPVTGWTVGNWNNFIDTGAIVLEALDEDPVEVPVELTLNEDVDLGANTFEFRYPNLVIDGDGNTVSGTVKYTDDAGVLENVVLGADGAPLVIDMTEVTEMPVSLGSGVDIANVVIDLTAEQTALGAPVFAWSTDEGDVAPSHENISIRVEDHAGEGSLVWDEEMGVAYFGPCEARLTGPTHETPIYTSFAGALAAAANEGDTITLLMDLSNVSGTVHIYKSVVLDGAGHKVTAAPVPEHGYRNVVSAWGGSKVLLKLETGDITLRNITIDGHETHAYTFLVSADNSSVKLTTENVRLLHGGELCGDANGDALTDGAGYGAAIHINNGAAIVVSNGFYACTGGEGETIPTGVFPFTGILVDENGGDVKFELTGDPNSVANVDIGNDLLLVGMPLAIDPDDAQDMLDYMKVPSRFIPYTLTLGDGDSSSFAHTFTGASPLGWNDIIEYGKEIMDVSTTMGYEGLDKNSTPVEVGLLTDTVLPALFTFADTNFTVNGNGNALSGEIKYTDNAGSIENIVLGTDENPLTLDMTGVSNLPVALGGDIDVANIVLKLTQEQTEAGTPVFVWDTEDVAPVHEQVTIQVGGSEDDDAELIWDEEMGLAYIGPCEARLTGPTHAMPLYTTLAAAVAAAQTDDRITLLSNVANAGEIAMTSGATFDGAGHTLSDNSTITLHPAGGTVKDVVFDDIRPERGEIPSVSTATNPNAGAVFEVAGCTFTAPGALAHVIIAADAATDFYATVTGNVFNAGTKTARAFAVVNAVDAEKLALTGNYVAGGLYCGASTNGVNASEIVYPMLAAADAAEATVTLPTFIVKSEPDGKPAIFGYSTLPAAVDSAKTANNDTILLTADATLDAAVATGEKNLTVDGQGHTLSASGSWSMSGNYRNTTDTSYLLTLQDMALVCADGDYSTARFGEKVVIGEGVAIDATAVTGFTLKAESVASGTTLVVTQANLTYGQKLLGVVSDLADVTVSGIDADTYLALSSDGFLVVSQYVAWIDDTPYMTLEDAIAAADATLETTGVDPTITLIGTGHVAPANWVVVENTLVRAVAKIGDVYFATLAEAYEAAQDGDTIAVLRDITLAAKQDIAKSITLDLGGKTITLGESEDEYAIGIASGSATFVGTGAIATAAGKYALYVAGGTASISNGTYSAIGVEGGTASIIDGTFNNGIVVAEGTATIEGGLFTAGTIGTEGDGTLAISGGYFYAPVPEEYCAAGYIPDPLTTEIDSVTYYTVKLGQYVAQVVRISGGATTTTKFETLADAFDAAQSGDSVELLTDIEFTGSQDITGKDIVFDGRGHKVTATGDTVGHQMFKVLSGNVAFTNVTLDVDHKYWFGVETVNSANLVLADVTVLRGGDTNLNYGAAIHANGSSLVVSGDFTAKSGGKTNGCFPFTGIIYEWESGGNIHFNDGVTADIGDDLLLIGMLGAPFDASTPEGKAEVAAVLSAMNVPSEYQPYTLHLDSEAGVLQGNNTFTGASKLGWNDIIDYGKAIMEFVEISTSETPVEVGLLSDTTIPGTFTFEDENFTINGNGYELEGTIKYKPTAGVISNVTLGAGATLDITDVTHASDIKFGEGVVVDHAKIVGDALLNQIVAEGDGIGGISVDNFDLTGLTIPEGSMLAKVDDGNGNLVLQVVTAVAKIGSTVYPSIQSAVDAAQDGDTVVLLVNETIADYVLFDDDKAVTLDLDGKTVTLATDSAASAGMIVAAGTVTITGGGEINSGEKISVAVVDGSLTISNGTFGVVGITDGTLSIVDGTFNAAPVALGGTTTISGGTFNDGLTTEDGTVTINGGTFNDDLVIDGPTTINGGTFNGYLLQLGGTATINDGTFNDDLLTMGTTTISDGIFNGDLFAAGGTIAVSGGLFDAPVPEAYCATGYIPKEEVEQTIGGVDYYTVKLGAYVAQIVYEDGEGNEILKKFDADADTTANDALVSATVLSDALLEAGTNSLITLIADPADLTPPEGWTFVTRGDVVTLERAVAQIVRGSTTIKYPSIQMAIDNAQDGDTVEVLRDVALDDGLTIMKSISLTGAVDGEGKPLRTITGLSNKTSADYVDIYVGDGDIAAVTVTISHLKLRNFGDAAAADGSSVVTFDAYKPGSALTVTNVDFAAYNQYAVATSGDGTLAVQGCTIDGTATDNRATGGVYARNGAAVVSGGTIQNVDVGIDADDAEVAIANVTVTANADGTAIASSRGAAVTVDGGDYAGALEVDAYSDLTVESGHFDRYVDETYCADGKIALPWAGQAGWYEVVAGHFVAAVIHDNGDGTTTTTPYASLKAAVDAAASGDTVKLLADDRLDEEIMISRSITITGDVDENGKPMYTIYGDPQDNYNVDVFIKNASTAIDVTIENVNLSEFGNQVNSQAGNAALYISRSTHADTHVVVSNVTFSSYNGDAIIAPQGHVEVVDCVIDGYKDPSSGKVLTGGVWAGDMWDDLPSATVSVLRTTIRNTDSNISGTTAYAIDARPGSTVTVTDCTITNVHDGIAAVATQESGAGGTSVTVSGTVVEADRNALAISGNPSASQLTVPSGLTVTSGTFTGNVVIPDAMSENGTIAISGGLFDAPVPEDYCAEGYIPQKGVAETIDGVDYYTVKIGAYVARNTTTGQGYETLEEALAEVSAGDDVTLLADVTMTQDVTLVPTGDISLTPDGKALDADGHTITIPVGLEVIVVGRQMTDLFVAPAKYVIDESEDDGLYSYTPVKVVAMIEDTPYTNFVDAVTAYQDGDTIVVVDYEDTMVAPEDWEFVTDTTVDPPVTTLEHMAYVARIESTGVMYTSLAKAIAAVPTDGTATTITMIEDETFAAEATLAVSGGRSVVLDLNGKTVAGSSSANQFFFLTVNAGNSLEVTNSNDQTEGKITFASTLRDFNNQRVTVYNAGGTLKVTAGTIENTTGGGMAYAVNNSANWGQVAMFEMTGGTLSSVGGDGDLRVYNNTSYTVSNPTRNAVTISGGALAGSGIFIDTFIGGTSSAEHDGSNVSTEINISGGSVNGLIDMKYRYAFNTSLNITGGDFTNTKLRVRKYAAEYNGAEPTEPLVTISDGKFAFAPGGAFLTTVTDDTDYSATYTNAYAVSGGVFDQAVPDAACATGYIPAANTDAETSAAYPYTVAFAADIVYPIEGTSGVPIALAWATNNTSVVSEGAPVTAADVPNIIEALGEDGANGMPKWQSYVLGLDPADQNARLRLTASPKTGTTVTIKGLIDTTKFPTIVGTTVTFRLVELNADGTWSTVDGAVPSSDEPTSFDVSLDTVIGKVLYIFADIETE